MAPDDLPPFAFDAPGATPEDMGVLELSWEVFGELCRALAVNVARAYDPEVVVGIEQAGVIPGAVIASILRLDFYSLKISRRSGFEEVQDQPQLLSSAPRGVRGKRVLIVDEICTTGETLRMALAAVRAERAADIRTATSFVKTGQYQPDFFAVQTDGTVIFPWDRQVFEGDELVKNPRYEHLL
jgi:hypoxanthine phosphoribosyltransferase